MKQELSYEIEHVDLSTYTFHDEKQTFDKSKYIVFWWKEIAVGHLYIELQSVLSHSSFINKLIVSVQPAINFYAQQSNRKLPEWHRWLLANQWSVWQDWLAEIFADYNTLLVPEKVQISVIICTRNRPHQLVECLLQLQSLVCRPEEIIVVDNAPNNDDTKHATIDFPNIIYVREPRPGLDIARNRGIVSASMPIVAFVDDDVRVHPLWIYRVWQTFQQKDVHAMTGLVIAMKLETEAQVIFEKFWSFNRGYIDITYDQAFYKSTLPAGPPVWKIGAGANMAFRKSVFNTTGQFDEMLDVGAAGCNGDSEMWFRILAKGCTIHYNPRAIVYHEHRRDMKGLKKQIYYYMRGFAAAAMSQQSQEKNAGYKSQLFKWLPYYYMKITATSIIRKNIKYKTLSVEVKGALSGIAYYLKNKKKFLKFESQDSK